MRPRSIRARLTTWYLAVLAIASLALVVATWWTLGHSVSAAADDSLRARVEGVQRFIATVERELPREEVLDEFREFSDLTLGETLLEVRDSAGAVLVAPSTPYWTDLRSVAASPGSIGSIAIMDRTAGDRPFRVAAADVMVANRAYHVIVAAPMGQALDALRRAQWLLAALVPGVLLLAGFGGHWISRSALAPVDRMTRAAQAITVRKLDMRLEVPPVDDELRRLAITFNAMLARLQSAVEDMVRLTAEASHELRTPVTLVRATAEVALSQERSAPEYRDSLVEIVHHAERLSSLVDDLLMLARADAGVEAGETNVVDAARLIRDVIHDAQPAIDRKGLSIALHADEPGADVDAHAPTLRRLVLILLDNAIKYTPTGGGIAVEVQRVTSAEGRPAVRIDVSDTGIGIDLAELPKVFDRFYRGSRARQLAADGSGLGLAIAQTIVNRYGGTIGFGATSGEGCRVSVTLPAHGQLTRNN